MGDALLAPSITRRLIREFADRLIERAAFARPPRAALGAKKGGADRSAGGWSNAEIGVRLHISASTAKTHVSRLLMKLDVNYREKLVMIAYETGLVVAG